VAVVILGLTVLGLLGQTSPARADELTGKSYHYAFDGKDRPERAWKGRAYVPRKAAKHKGALPLLVFLHGLNKELIEYRWMGGGREGDVRRIAGELVEAGAVTPFVVAGPSSTVASEVSRGASWNHFDLDNFIDRTAAALKGVVAVDETRIIVAGHSGAGCSDTGGLARVGESKRRLLAIVSIDTCMGGSLAQRLGEASAGTHVLVSYQSATWTTRPFALFKQTFERMIKKHPPADGILRELDHQHPKTSPHDATVKLTFDRWLPVLLGRPPS
jgi:hypothetical protein